MLGLIAGGAQMIGGLIQGISGSRQARRAENALENLKTPTTTSDAAINSYYTQANANPYDTNLYKQQSQQATRNLATGLNAAQDRRGGLASIAGLVRGSNDSLLRAGVAAEQQQRAMLANATRMKSMDNQRVWEINKMMPYQKKFTLLGQKAAGGNAKANAGWSNLFGGLQTMAMSAAPQDGTNGGGGGGKGFFGGLFGGGGGGGMSYSTPNMGMINTETPYASPAASNQVTGRTFPH
jgi:hypothetical protein